jgi:hypothetical protein
MKKVAYLAAESYTSAGRREDLFTAANCENYIYSHPDALLVVVVERLPKKR